MDINLVVTRAKAILTTPKTEWPVIAERPETVAALYKNYIAIIAAIPAVFGFVKGSLIGYGALGVTVRAGLVSGLIGMVVRYLLTLGLIYVLALVIEVLAPNFGGQKNRLQALKAIGYSFTAGAVASAALILPWFGGLIAMAGGLYSLYLLYLGLPVTMKTPPEKALPYTGLVVAAGIVLAILGGMLGLTSALSGLGSHASSDIEIEKGSHLSKLEELGKRLEAASNKMDEAQKSGDAAAQQKAMGQMMGAVMGGGGAEVEALAPERIKAFLPDTLAGLARTDSTAERNGAMGLQMSEARATYSDGAMKSMNLEITDMGSAKGFAAMASWAALEQDKVSDTGFEKTYKAGGRTVHEQWDNQSKDGEYSLILADRFSVKVSGSAESLDALKGAAESLDLTGLEALKNEGVKQGG